MENSETYDSFQHELEDYIRKQKARGLEPEICFRKVTDDSAYRGREHAASKPLMLEPRLFFRSSHKRLGTVESQLPPRTKIHHSRQRLESLNHCQKNHDPFFENPWLSSPPVQPQTNTLRAARRGEDARCLAKGCPGVHPAGGQDGGQKRRSREEAGRGHGEEERAERKKQHPTEEEAYKEKGRKAVVEPGSAEKREHRRKSSRDQDTTKEGRGSGREKLPPGKEIPQERDLWDEAILGSCY
ncbi:lysine-rich coiled-coil protein 1-like [Hipposideros larvatus]